MISWYRSARYRALRHALVPWKWPRTVGSGLSASQVMSVRRSAQTEASSFEAHSSPQWSVRVSMYGIASAA